MNFEEIKKLAQNDPKFRRQIQQSAARIKRQIQLAEKRFSQFHWSDAPSQIQKAQAPEIRPGEVLYSLGELVAITYRASKGGSTYDWAHDFKPSRPELASTTSGDLVIVGGDYKINQRGIVG